VLGELVGRRALDRVLDVATRVDLLAFESPDFYDRLRRAQAHGPFRSLETVNGLLGIIGAGVAVVAIVGALAALQPLLLPLVVLGYIPLWIVAAKNGGDLRQRADGARGDRGRRARSLSARRATSGLPFQRVRRCARQRCSSATTPRSCAGSRSRRGRRDRCPLRAASAG
jgi:hypothetical protein